MVWPAITGWFLRLRPFAALGHGIFNHIGIYDKQNGGGLLRQGRAFGRSERLTTCSRVPCAVVPGAGASARPLATG
jgi:hypothetical protein